MSEDLTNCSDSSKLNENFRKISAFFLKNENQEEITINSENQLKINKKTKRDQWSNDIEFLMSCIALSVGLGNVWRFPFTALDNGGGAFVIPYIIVLVLIGKPIYYLEMIIGQFSSRGSIKVFDFAPGLRGIGYGQVFGTAVVTTFYASLMALTVRYIFDSMRETLPWSECLPEWNQSCVDSKISSLSDMLANSTSIPNISLENRPSTSAELYFLKNVIHEKDSIHDGIGYPDLKLVLCLGVAWLIVVLILIRGVKSSGKASYFLAIFPYVVMIILLIRAITLPGAIDGIVYFITPQWTMILKPKVWYAAVTQVFFSLAICFGNINMYSSYNRFGHNIYRDAAIVSALDTMTSILAGCIIFGILGHLAHENGIDNMQDVVTGGTVLAFVTYPDAIAKFKYLPQVFSVLFFAMLFVLGIGSTIGQTSVIMTAIRDKFPKLRHWFVAIMIALMGWGIGCIYLTPGGQYILNLFDFFGASFIAFVLAIGELIGLGWIYGVNRLCKDVEFMLNIKTSIYWRICWGFITPLMMIVILIYTIIDMEPLKYRDYVYPDAAYVFGWCLSAFGILQLPLWLIYSYTQQTGSDFKNRLIKCFQPTSDWGPMDGVLFEKYTEFRMEQRQIEASRKSGFWNRIKVKFFDIEM